MNTDIEIWKPIQGHENYAVSTKGRVKNLRTNYILKPLPCGRKQKIQYVSVDLDRKRYLIHRLVAQTFIPNPENLPQCNHLDENPQNNCVENLCWMSAKQNSNYGTRNERSSAKRFNHPKRSTPIECKDLKTNETKFFPSIHEADRQLGIKFQTIHHWCKKDKPYMNRYIFNKKEID